MQYNQDVRLMMKCCSKYYFEGVSQSEIAKQMGISHPTVCRLIKKAREQGILKIELVNPLEQESYTELEHAVERRFGLKEVVVVPDMPTAEQQHMEVGRAAAEYLERFSSKHSIVGVSMGTTLRALANCAFTGSKGNHHFVPLIGGVGNTVLELQSNQIADSYAKKFGGYATFVHIPAFVDNPEIRLSLMQDENVQELMGLYNRLDAAMVSIGTANRTSTLMRTGLFSDEMIEKLHTEGAVGDVCLQFFDINGEHNKFAVNRQVVAIDLEQLKALEWSVGLVSGDDKTMATVGAIRARFINVLITHQSLAESLMKF